jgi:hypothetical protein
MTDNDHRIIELQRALDQARDRLARAERELERYEPIGPDYRDNGRRLADDVACAKNDVALLASGVLNTLSRRSKKFQPRGEGNSYRQNPCGSALQISCHQRISAGGDM